MASRDEPVITNQGLKDIAWALSQETDSRERFDKVCDKMIARGCYDE